MKIYIIWLIGVVIWNFGFPNAQPIEDVMVAILLSFLSIGLKKYINEKLNNVFAVYVHEFIDIFVEKIDEK